MKCKFKKMTNVSNLEMKVEIHILSHVNRLNIIGS